TPKTSLPPIAWPSTQLVKSSLFESPGTLRDPHSFPTRRSSDLARAEQLENARAGFGQAAGAGNGLRDRGVEAVGVDGPAANSFKDRKSTRLNSSHDQISYAVFCLKKKRRRS